MDCNYELGHEDVCLEDDGTMDTVVSWECECGLSGQVRLAEVDRDEHGDITDEGWQVIVYFCQDDHER